MILVVVTIPIKEYFSLVLYYSKYSEKNRFVAELLKFRPWKTSHSYLLPFLRLEPRTRLLKLELRLLLMLKEKNILNNNKEGINLQIFL